MADALASGGALAPDRAPSHLRVSLLGSMQVECGGRLLHVAGPQRRRLLAVLACRAGRVVSIDALIDAMWGDDPPPSAAKTVQSHVVRLRHSLADAGEPIETGPGGYRLLVDDDAIDIQRFDALVDDGFAELDRGHHASAARVLEAAGALWRGPALAEFAADDFAVGERARLEERRLLAQEALAEARLAGHMAAGVVSDMERVVAEAPGRERAWALLMRALYAVGRQQEALAAYQRARRALADDFGLEPGPELRELERRVVAQDPSLQIPQRPVAPAALRADGPLIGRSVELEWLRSAWRQAATGLGQVRTVLGPVGSGRTRLVAELAADALDDGAAVEYVAGATGLHEAAGPSGPGAVVDAIADRCRESALLLVIDDVQWTPQSSVDAIRALATAAERIRVLVVLVGHDGEGPGIDLVRDLERSVAAALRLPPMHDADIAEILVRDGIESDAVTAVVGLADGLPGVARREAAAWSERAAAERLDTLARTSFDARLAATDAEGSVTEQVLRLVETRGRRAELAAADWVGRQPYRSLATYEAADADLFVGRERIVAELVARVLDRRLVALVGASGIGKSSIVRAGLLPIVRSGRLPGGSAWRADVVVPGTDPVGVLDALAVAEEPGPRLLVIDQFEEVLATGELDTVAARLLDLLFDPAMDARVVIVVRADQLGAVAASRSLADMIEDAQMLVGPPSTEELRRIVLEPARRTGCVVEPELVSMVVADVAGHEAALPLVSAAMTEVWAQRTDDVLTCSTYREIGGLAAAVERLGDRALAAVGPGGEARVRDVMLRLVDVADDGAWVRRRCPVDDVPAESVPALGALVDARLVAVSDGAVDVVHEVVFHAWPHMADWLVEARADLVLGRDLRASARSWDSNGRSDDDVVRGGRLHAATEWAARADHVPPLVSEFLTASTARAAGDERAIREQLRRERRGRMRLRVALTVASALLLVAVTGVGVAVRNSRRAERERDRADLAATEAGAAADLADRSASAAATAAAVAEERRAEADALRVVADRQRTDAQVERLVAESHGNRDRDLALSLLLAVESNRSVDAAATRGALLSALRPNGSSPRTAASGSCCETPDIPHVHSSFVGFVSGPARVVDSIAISSDGRVVATAGSSEDGSAGAVFVFDVERRELVHTVPTPTRHPRISVAADGSRVLVVDDGTVSRLDVGTGELRDVDEAGFGRRGAVQAFFAGSGDRFVVLTALGGLHLFDTASLAPVAVDLPQASIGAAGIAPDGTLAIGAVDSVSFWDLASNEEVRSVALASAGDVEPSVFAISADMAWLAGVEQAYGRVVVWDLATGDLVGDLGARPQTARAIAFDPTEPSTLAVGSADGVVTLLDVATGQTLGTPLRGQAGGVRALAFSRGGEVLVTTNDDGSIALWSDNGGPSLLSEPISDGRLFDVSADGEIVVVGDEHAVDVRDEAGRSIRLVAPSADADAATWWDISADGARVLWGALVADTHHMAVYDTTTGAEIWSTTTRAPSYFPGFSSDGSMIASPVGDERRSVRIWDLGADRSLGRFDVSAAFPNASAFVTGPPQFTPDGEHFVVAMSHGLAMTEIATGRTVAIEIPGGGPQGRVGIAGDGGVVFAAGQRGAVWRWDVGSGELRSGRSRESSSLFGAGVSADGGVVAAPHGFASTVALFDGATLEPIGDPIPTGDVGEWASIAVAADGTRLFTNDGFNRAAEWNLDVETWPAIACRAAGRNLTPAEFAEHLGDATPYRATCEEWSIPT